MEFVKKIKSRLADLAERAPHLADPRDGIKDLAGIVSDLVNGPPEEAKEPEKVPADPTVDPTVDPTTVPGIVLPPWAAK